MPVKGAETPLNPFNRGGGRPKGSKTVKRPEPVLTPKKRGGGKPKGLPKTGGRKKGSPNRTHIMTAEQITKLADPLGLLCQIARGVRLAAALSPGSNKNTFMFPTLDQRITAAQTLARKVLPDQKAVEHSGPRGEPLSVRINLGAASS